MTVGIVGLGLIGGSFAKAYSAAGERVLAFNRTRSVLDFAIMSGCVDAELTRENISGCDLVLITLYPRARLMATVTCSWSSAKPMASAAFFTFAGTNCS